MTYRKSRKRFISLYSTLLNSLYHNQHKITTIKNSILNITLGDNPTVNTRHEYALKEVKEPFKITAVSDDNEFLGRSSLPF